MSDETPIPPLPEPVTMIDELTYAFPALLLAASVDANGFVTKTIRDGQSKQVKFATVTTYSDDEPEPEQPFVIKGLNRIKAGDFVLNNAINYQGLTLPATSPSADEYLALVGQEVCVAFKIRRDNPLTKARGIPTFRKDRTTIVLQ